MERIFVIRLTVMVDRATQERHLPAHLDYLAHLKARGALLLSGPFADRSGGMVVVRAATHDDAEALAQHDPLVASGANTYDLREWIITDGLPDQLPSQCR